MEQITAGAKVTLDLYSNTCIEEQNYNDSVHTVCNIYIQSSQCLT